MHLSRRYALLARLFYALYLALGLALIVLTVLDTPASNAILVTSVNSECGTAATNVTAGGEEASVKDKTILSHVSFGIALLTSAVLSVQV